MATTTFELIVENLRRQVESRTPTRRTDIPFRRYPGDMPEFDAWAAEVGEGAFRCFDIRHAFDLQFTPPYDLGAYFTQHGVIVQVAYPDVSLRYGPGVDVHGDTLIDADAFDIDKAIGQPAARLDGHHDSRFDGGSIVQLGGVRVLSLVFALTYNRSIPS
jgi:hypothetical protein